MAEGATRLGLQELVQRARDHKRTYCEINLNSGEMESFRQLSCAISRAKSKA